MGPALIMYIKQVQNDNFDYNLLLILYVTMDSTNPLCEKGLWLIL